MSKRIKYKRPSFVPDEWSVICHDEDIKKGYDLKNTIFYTTNLQLSNAPPNGAKVCEKIDSMGGIKPNIHLLIHLLANQDEIPTSWRSLNGIEPLKIFFWGTIFSNKISDFVCYIYWSNGEWKGIWRPVDTRWNHHCVALLFKQTKTSF